MKEYQKINTVFKRPTGAGNKDKVVMWDWSLPEFEYLKDMPWVWTEKIDGTNIRVGWHGDVEFGGHHQNSQIPATLVKKFQDLFPVSKFNEHYPLGPMTLFGEGYGAGIQKGGTYIPNGVDFILFDVWIDEWWLERENIEDIASVLGIEVVPILFECSPVEAVARMKEGVTSIFGNFQAEGIVGKPKVSLYNRRGDRIITKMKHKDFP